MMVKATGENGDMAGLFRSAKRTTTNAASGKLKAASVIMQVEEDAIQIIRNLDLISHTLTSRDVLRIQDEAERIIQKKGRKYAKYEIAHYFLVRQLTADLRIKIKLTEQEEMLLKDAMGRLYYNVPDSIRSRQVEAAQELAQMGPRGDEIYDGTKAQIAALVDEVRKAITTMDMFHNPIGIFDQTFQRKRGFAELAEFFRPPSTSPYYE